MEFRGGTCCSSQWQALTKLIAELSGQRERDSALVHEVLPDILRRANTVQIEGAPADERWSRELFALRQVAEQEAKVSLDYMFCLLVSTCSVSDLRAVNPFISIDEVRELLDLVVSAILHASRVGQINRCVSEAHGLLRLLQSKADGATSTTRQEVVAAISLKAQTLAEELLTRRHYVSASGAPVVPGALGRVYDPRFLLFEFTHNLVLRKSQVNLVLEFVNAVLAGRPMVKQMLMGGGKTTVVGPLLALILGDGERLVLQTMPPALLEQSKATLRATFSSIVRKRVFTLSFDRSSEMRWETVDKLQATTGESSHPHALIPTGSR